jgi:hypothetical protein
VTKSPSNSPDIGVSDREYSRITPRPVWATVIGACSIAIGVINLLSFVLAMSFLPQGPYAPAPPGSSHVEFGLLGSMILPAGVRTLQRRRSARDLHILYAGMFLLLWTAITLQGIHDSRRLLTGFQALMNGQMQPSLIPAFLTEIAWLLWIVLLIAHATFLLVWFFRRDIRKQVAAWPIRSPKRHRPGETP